MPYAKRDCGKCGRSYSPKSKHHTQVCGTCQLTDRLLVKSMGIGVPHGPVDLPCAPMKFEPKRNCEVCTTPFLTRLGQTRCPACQKLAQTEPNTAYDQFSPGGPLPHAKVHRLASPLIQGVFDLETFSLDRGWGVLMVGSILVHGDGPEPKTYTFDLTESPKWPGVRSDDSDLAARVMQVLSKCHVLFAHNGVRFDLAWLNSLALKYGLPRLNPKIIDPVLIARQKYRIGNNSLSALASFLGIEENKMPVPPDVWRTALFDNDPDSWRILRERCESDVRILNQVASAVTLDVGFIDKSGSWR